MELRMIFYGYRKEQFTYFADQNEAEIVERIFREYVGSKTLQKIANELTAEQIVYYKDKTVWNKNMVRRILENRHYIGDSEYPKIIDENVFKKAETLRLSKGGKREKDTKEIEFLKGSTICANCGKGFTRRSKYKTRERWLCSNGCPSTTEYLDDITFFSKILSVLKFVRDFPSKLMYESEPNVYEPTKDIIEKEKQIKDLMFREKPLFQPIKQLIFESQALKFSVMGFDMSKEKTLALCDYFTDYTGDFKELDLDFIKTVVSKIIVEADGKIRIRFVNGQEISERQVTENG